MTQVGQQRSEDLINDLIIENEPTLKPLILPVITKYQQNRKDRTECWILSLHK